MELSKLEKDLLKKIADIESIPIGAFNIRENGKGVARNTTTNIDIITKTDKPGIDIIIKPNTKNESVHIPVILTEAGFNDIVYNDFYIGENADVVIVAGCGIHNNTCETSNYCTFKRELFFRDGNCTNRRCFFYSQRNYWRFSRKH